MNKITVTKPFLPPKEEFLEYIDQIWDNRWLTNKGPLHETFSDRLKEYLQSDNINLVVNGHMALDIAIKGLELKGEVITTPFTFASTVHALTLNGIKPVFCDINENDLTMDVNKIESLITSKTTAILPVHVYGHPCDVIEIKRIAEKHNLKVLYDAAHAFGVKLHNQSLCNYGDVSIFSFHATKLFNSIEGGALIYHKENLTRLFNAYKNFGIEGEDKIDYIGSNAKMNEFQAAMGLANLKYVDSNIEERKQITYRYRNNLKDIAGIKCFFVDKEIENKGGVYNYSYMPILIDDQELGLKRDQIYEHLKTKGIFTRRYFWPIITEFGCYRKEYKNIGVPVAKKISENILCLPIYNGLSYEEIDFICSEIKLLVKSNV